MHGEIGKTAEDNVGIIREETPSKHGPEDVTRREGREYYIEGTFGGAGVARGWNKVDSRCDGDDRHETRNEFDIGAEGVQDEEWNTRNENVEGYGHQNGL